MSPDIRYASWVVAEVGALNWGLQEAFGLNLVTELLGSGSSAVGIVYLVIGLAGAVGLADKAGLVDLEELV